MKRALVRGLGLVLATWGLPLAAQEAPATRVSPAPVDFDLHEIRNIFRFGDEPSRGAAAESLADAAPNAGEPAPSVAAGSEGPRLVGLVRRADRLVAALAVDGEVVLLSKGQSVGGFTVTEISEEGVGLRGPGGDEITLRLP